MAFLYSFWAAVDAAHRGHGDLLAAMLRKNGYQLTEANRELLAQLVEGSLPRKRGRPKKGIIFNWSEAQAACWRIAATLDEMRERGESVRGARKRLIEQSAERTGLPIQAFENIFKKRARTRAKNT